MADIVKLPKATERTFGPQHRKPGAVAEIVIFPGVRYEQRGANTTGRKPKRAGPRKRRS